MKQEYNQSGMAHLATILVVVVIAAIGVVGWKVWDTKKTDSVKDSTTSETAVEQTSDPKKYIYVLNTDNELVDQVSAKEFAQNADQEAILEALHESCSDANEANIIVYNDIFDSGTTAFKQDGNYAFINAVTCSTPVTNGEGLGAFNTSKFLHQEVNGSWKYDFASTPSVGLVLCEKADNKGFPSTIIDKCLISLNSWDNTRAPK